MATLKVCCTYPFVEDRLIICLSVIVILSVRRLIKALLVMVIGILGSIELWLSVSQATVLERSLGLFLFHQLVIVAQCSFTYL